MTDIQLEQIKKFFNNFTDLADFKEKYINIQKPANEAALIELFNDTKKNSDAWELSKFFRSSESLRLDKLFKHGNNITIEQIINTIKKYDLHRYKRVIISLDNKNYEDIERLYELGIDIYIRVKGDKGICTLDEFKKMRNFFNSFVERYSSYKLSVLEKITLAYDCVKFFSYNEEENDKLTDSRSIAKSISTGHIVCEGYSRIFCQLLDELNVTSNLAFIKPTIQEQNGHVRTIVKVNDEKYGINGIFVFDPTWDSNMDMSLVQHTDSTLSYEISRKQKPDDIIVEKLPSAIRYLFYMIPLYEYNKYFPHEQFEKIEKFQSGENIELTDDLIKLINYNDLQPRDNSILEIIPNLLIKTKKIEGYSEEQIMFYIKHVISLLQQDRFGRFDKNLTEKSKKTL